MYILYKSHDTARFYTLVTAKLELQFTLPAYSRINAAKTAPSDDSCLLRSGFKTSTSIPNLRAFHAETSAQSVLQQCQIAVAATGAFFSLSMSSQMRPETPPFFVSSAYSSELYVALVHPSERSNLQ